MVNNFNQGDTFKTVIDLGTVFIGVLDTLINKWGIIQNLVFPITIIAGIKLLSKNITGLIGYFTKMGTAMTAANAITVVNDKTAKKLGKTLTDLSLNQKILILSTQNLTKEQQIAALMASGLTRKEAEQAAQNVILTATQRTAAGSTNLLKVAMNGLTAAIAANPVGAILTAITIAITGITMAINHYNESQQEMIDKAKELRESFQTTSQTIKENINILNSLDEEFRSLSKGIDEYGNNIGLTAEEYSRYKEIVTKIVGISPELSNGFDEENGYLVDKNGLLERSIDLQKQEYQQQLKSITTVQALTTSMKGYITEYNKLLKDGNYIYENGFVSGKVAEDFQNAMLKAFNVYERKDYAENSKIVEDIAPMFAEDILKSLDISNIDEYMKQYYNDAGYFQSNKFWQENQEMIIKNLDKVLENLSQDIESIGLDQATLNENITEVTSAAQVYLDFANSVDTASKKIQDDLKLSAQASAGFQELTNSQQAFVDSFISGFDIKDVTGKEKDLLGNFVIDEEKVKSAKTQVREFVNTLQGSVVSNGTKVTEAIDNLFKIDKTKVSASEWREQADELLNEIFKALNITDQQTKLDIRTKLNIVTIDDSGNAISVDTDIKNQIIKRFEDVNFEDLKNLTEQELQIAIKLDLEAEGIDNFQALMDKIQETIYETMDASFDLQNISDNVKDFTEEISSVYSNMDILDSAMDEFNQIGKISAATFKSLSENNLIQYLNWSSEGLSILTEGLTQSAEATRVKAETTLKLALMNDLANIATRGLTDEEYNQVKALQSSGSQANDTKQQLSFLRSEMDDCTASAIAFNTAIAGTGGKQLNIDAQKQQIQEVFDMYKQTLTTMNQVAHVSSSTSNAFGGVKKSANDAKSAVQELTSALKASQSAINSLLNATMSMIKESYSSRKDSIQDQIDDLADEYNSEKDYLNDIKKAKDKEYKAERKRIDDLKKSENDRYEQRKEQLEKEYKEIQKNYDKQKENLENELKAYQERINSEIEFLRLKEEERKYDKEVEEKRNDISKITNELSELEFNNSISAQKRKLELIQELADRQEELEELQHDRDVTLQEDALNNELDRYEKLQNSKIEALEKEAERQKQIYEDRIGQLEAEHETYINNLEAKLDAIEREKELWDESHQNRLDNLEEEYQSNRSYLESELNDISDYVSKESNIRKEAIADIESRSNEFYQKLLLWNREYGTGVDADVKQMWNLAYAALEQFAGENGTINVQNSLETIAEQMYAIENQTQKVASSFKEAAGYIKDAANALEDYSNIDVDKPKRDVYSIKNYGLEPKKSHGGEKFVTKMKNPLDKTLGLKNNETLRILKVGEGVIPVEENLRNLNSDDEYLDKNTSKNFSKMSKVNKLFTNQSNGDSRIIMGDINIQGNATTETVIALKKERENIVQEMFSRIEKHSKQGGFRNMKLFSI